MAKKTKKPKVPKLRVYRDATTGRFVTKKYAKKNPKSTVKESRRRSMPASPTPV